jgi:hypothetical protein
MLWLTIIVLIIVGLIALLLKARSKQETIEYPYQKAGPIFSPAERSFFGVLEKSVGDKYRVLGKIRLADSISPISGLSASAQQKALNRIVSKHLDFALCNKDDLYLVCAIELDDSSHKKSEGESEMAARIRDQGFRKAIVAIYDHRCALCGIRMLTPDGHTVVEAAHIKPWSESYDDRPANGLSLCRLCHWPFDEGLMSVGVKYEVLGSSGRGYLNDEGAIGSEHGCWIYSAPGVLLRTQ